MFFCVSVFPSGSFFVGEEMLGETGVLFVNGIVYPVVLNFVFCFGVYETDRIRGGSGAWLGSLLNGYR